MVKGKIKAKEIVLKITEGVLKTTMDATLFSLFLVSSSVGKSRSSLGVHQTFNEAYEVLSEFNYKTVKNALQNLKRQGLVSSIKKWETEPLITRKGLQRLKNLLPCYEKIRPWDGFLYLISYDISRKTNFKRDFLRNYLYRIGCGYLQQSLFITPYNPTKLIERFIKENNINGQILISCLGKDGAVGKDDIYSLVRKVYKLDELNDHYKEFIAKYKKIEKGYSKQNIAFDFFAILKNDPQLPFKLLPKNFLGEQAYFLFKKLAPEVKISKMI